MEIKDNVLIDVQREDIKNGIFIVPDGIIEIGTGAFEGLFSLEKVIIPDSVTKIGDCVFSDCKYLKKIEISENVTEIGSFAFFECVSLESITIPSNVVKIGDNAFCNCSSLQTVLFLGDVKELGDMVFDDCTSLRNIVLPDSIKELGTAAFEGCSSLKNVNIPCWDIKPITFEDCISLENIVLNSDYYQIGDNAFYNCPSFKSITFSSSFIDISTYIINRFFENCPTLKKVIVYGERINLKNFDVEIRRIRKKELLDKIAFYLASRGILDKEHYKYDRHKNFIDTTLKKFDDHSIWDCESYIKEYVEEYIAINCKNKDEQLDTNLKSLNDNVVNHDVKKFNPSGAVDIIKYGDELLENITKIEEIIAMIPDNYGPTNIFLEEELDKLKNPRNIIQLILGDKDNKNIYLGNDSLKLLIYSTANNIYRLELGIQKLEELENILELYIEKINEYKDNLLNYRVITIDANEVHKDDDILIQNKISKKADSYEKHLILVNDIQEKIHNLINCYKIYIGKLQRIDLLLETIKDGKKLNSGVVNEKESLERLREILDFYNNIEESNVIKK